MPNLDEIYNQISNLKDTSRVIRCWEVKELPGILRDDEKIERIAAARFRLGSGIVLATDIRLLFVDQAAVIGGTKIKEFPYYKIDSIQYKTGFLKGELAFFSSGKEVIFSDIENSLVPGIADYVSTKISPSTIR